VLYLSIEAYIVCSFGVQVATADGPVRLLMSSHSSSQLAAVTPLSSISTSTLSLPTSCLSSTDAVSSNEPSSSSSSSSDERAGSNSGREQSAVAVAAAFISATVGKQLKDVQPVSVSTTGPSNGAKFANVPAAVAGSTGDVRAALGPDAITGSGAAAGAGSGRRGHELSLAATTSGGAAKAKSEMQKFYQIKEKVS